MLATLDAPAYIERTLIGDPKYTMKTRNAVRKAIKTQIDGKGFSLVEALSACPSGWKMDPVDAKNWTQEQLVKQFPLGVTVDRTKETAVTEASGNGRAGREKRDTNIHDLLDIPSDDDETLYSLPDVQPKYKHAEIKIAGFGGQGVLSLGIALSQMGMMHQYYVSWLPSYGPEMRGGTAHCHVKLSHEPIGTPLIANPTILVAMNKPSLDKFEETVITGGDIFYNQSLIDSKPERADVDVIPIPATRIADDLGNTKAANIVMLGAMIAHTGILEPDAVIQEMDKLIKKSKYVPLNQKALKAGIEAFRNMTE
jgi:2-oxoisovalerate ferredoxin oxidoreductase beta subunit